MLLQDQNVSPSYQKLLDYTKGGFATGMLTVDLLATAFAPWIKAEDWNKVICDLFSGTSQCDAFRSLEIRYATFKATS